MRVPVQVLVPVGQEHQVKVTLVGYLVDHLITRAGEAGERGQLDQAQPDQLVVLVALEQHQVLLVHQFIILAVGEGEITTGELAVQAAQVVVVEVLLVLPEPPGEQIPVAGVVQEVRLHLITIITAVLAVLALSSSNSH
jgi:hypothetical protein